MSDRATVEMPRWRFRGYVKWLGDSWELGDVAQLAFAYHALRQG